MKNKLFLIILSIIIIVASGVFIYLVRRGTIKPAAQTAQPTIYLNPSSASENIGTTFNVDIVADSSGQAITGIDVFYLHYDNQKLSAQSVSNGTLFPNYQSRNNTPIDAAAGTINLSGYYNPGSNNQQVVSGVYATITFKAQAAGVANLSFDFSPGATTDTNMSRDTGGGNIIDILQVANGANFTVQSATPSPTVDLKVDGKDGTISKNTGESAALLWTSTNATSCQAGGGWSGSKQTSGNQTLTSLASSAVYTLTCTGAGGSAQDSVTINVSQPGKNPPAVNIKANNQDGPISITAGSAATLSWTSTNASSCSASGAWSGSKATSGSESTGNLSASKTYSLACQNADGNTIDSVTVNISATGSQNTTSNSTNSTGTTTTPKEATNLPSNIQTQAKPTQTAITLTKNEAMKPWALWFLYAIIPAFLAGGAIYLYLKRRKVNHHDETV